MAFLVANMNFSFVLAITRSTKSREELYDLHDIHGPFSMYAWGPMLWYPGDQHYENALLPDISTTLTHYAYICMVGK